MIIISMLKVLNNAIGITILAQEIIVGHASYPTKKIEENSPALGP